jgi:hypothetical protein
MFRPMMSPSNGILSNETREQSIDAITFSQGVPRLAESIAFCGLPWPLSTEQDRNRE